MKTFIAIILCLVSFSGQEREGFPSVIDTDNLGYDAEQAGISVYYYNHYLMGEGIPVMIINCLIPGTASGKYFPIINIICIEPNSSYPLVAHEIQHAIDWYSRPGLTRYEFENRAYRRQDSIIRSTSFVYSDYVYDNSREITVKDFYLDWMPTKALKTRTSTTYPKIFYLGLIYTFSSRFIEEAQMEEFITDVKDREALLEWINLGLITEHNKKNSSGKYYEINDFKRGTYGD